MREAGDRTTWADPDEPYEAAVHAAVDAAFDDERVGAVIARLDERVDVAGRSNALSAKLARPGDPRRPRRLPGHRAVGPEPRRPRQPPARSTSRTAPRCWPARRRTRRGSSSRVVLGGSPCAGTGPSSSRPTPPVLATGDAADHVIAFDRGGCVDGGDPAAGRARRAGGWGDTRLALPPGSWTDVLTGRTTDGRLADLLEPYPVALLVRDDGEPRFDVWAPKPAAGAALGRRRRGRDGARAPTAGGRRPSRCPTARSTTATSSTTTPLRARPALAAQPEGPHGRSRTVDPRRTSGATGAWEGRELAGSVVYELHVGTFTPEGTLDAAVGRLDHLVDLGVGFVELMPVNAFDGTHNWGYDGVGWFAVDETYGGPAAYQRFVDACHRAGLGVVQDVVYNHLGPSGNYLPLFGPYLKADRNTLGRPGQPRRRGLGRGAALHPRQRPDVARGLPRRRVAARRRARAPGLLGRPSARGDGGARSTRCSERVGRPLTLIAESDLNDPQLITPRVRRRLRPRRPVERRLPPRPARRADR